MGICFLYFLYFQQSGISIIVPRPCMVDHQGGGRDGHLLLTTSKTTEIFYTRGEESLGTGLRFNAIQNRSKNLQRRLMNSAGVPQYVHFVNLLEFQNKIHLYHISNTLATGLEPRVINTDTDNYLLHFISLSKKAHKPHI